MDYPRISKDISHRMHIPDEAWTDTCQYIATVRAGIPGSAVKTAVELIGSREPFIKLFNTTPGNFSRVYAKHKLTPSDSENLLDSMRVYLKALQIWGNADQAQKWLNSPIPALAGQKPLDLFDTSEGRDWVRRVLGNIEYGEFT